MAIDMGKKIAEELKKNDKDKDDAWKRRLNIWHMAKVMCEQDKTKFKEGINGVIHKVKRLETPVEFVDLKPFTENFSESLDQYLEDVNRVSAANPEMSEMDTAMNKAMMGTLQSKIDKAQEDTVRLGKEASQLKHKLI